MPPETVHGSARFTVGIEPEGNQLTCAADQSLLAAMERAGIGRHKVGCRGGGCGRCRIRITEGSIVSGKISRAHVSLEQQQQGYALACRAYPRSDLRLFWAPAAQPAKP